MDDKGSRRRKHGGVLRRVGLAEPGKIVKTLLTTQRSVLLTVCMILLSVALLFGICSQLQPPATNVAPAGMTAIGYSAFVGQVQTGNVVAVVIKGDEINGLLEKPLGQADKVVQKSASQAAGDYITWGHYIKSGNTNAQGTLPIDPARSVFTRVPAKSNAQLMDLLLSKGVIVSTMPVLQQAGWLTWFWRLVPFLFLIVMLIVFMASRNNTRSAKPIDDRVTQIGKSRARRFVRIKENSTVQSDPKKNQASTKGMAGGSIAKTKTEQLSKAAVRVSQESTVTFADVAGIDEVRAELEEIVQFLRDPEKYNKLGARIPRGALLVGPPGTGKTLLAKAVAGEADVPFFSMSASEFIEMFVGVGASRVRDLFNQARQAAPCVVFIDEIDAVGRKRSMRITGNDERDQTLNQLLVELDGFDPRKAIVVLAATNRADILDKAILRPGRFDRRISVSLPDRVGREAILKVHTRQTPLHEEVHLARLARMTTGMSGADLANLVNEAALSAARRDLEHITHDCFEEALARVQLGALRPLAMSERDRKIIAFHEGGHALTAYHLAEADTVNRVTILPRGQSLGVTQFTAEEDRYNYSRETLMARIAVGLGGRVAEELTFGPERVTTGAENDLQVVTDLARRMVTRWGMSEQVGVVFADYRAEGEYSLNLRKLGPDELPAQAYSLVMNADGTMRRNGSPRQSHQQFAMASAAAGSSSSPAMNALIDVEVQRILDEGRQMARAILSEHYNQLTTLADALMEHEQLDRTQFESLLVE